MRTRGLAAIFLAVAVGAIVGGAGAAAAQLPTPTTTTTVRGPSSVTFGATSTPTPAPGAIPGAVPGATAPTALPQTLPQTLPGTGAPGATAAPIPARTGFAPGKLAIGVALLGLGTLVVVGIPKPGRHAKGYRRATA